MNHKSKAWISRRGFLRKVSVYLAITAGIMAGFSLLRQALPRLSRKRNRLKIGTFSRFPVNMYTYLADEKVFIYRDHEGISAVSAICTHLGCVIEQTEDGFQCPCHGSCFDPAGVVLSGAASKNLPWYRIIKDADGQLVLDLTATVEPEYKLFIS